MTVIACVDDRGGMLFNNRRQSRDEMVLKRISDITENSTLFVSEFSKKLFEDAGIASVKVSDSFLDEAQKGDYCFIENVLPGGYKERIEQIVLYRWNRKYPGDFFFDIDVTGDGWRCISKVDFAGSSHEKITEEVYIR